MEHIVHWGTLRILGNSKVVTSSLLWLFVVPVAAQILIPVAAHNPITIPFITGSDNTDSNNPNSDNTPITIMILLPFKWVCFYIMAWMFVIGQVFYWIACPALVKHYGSFGEYRSQHAGVDKFFQLLHPFYQKMTEIQIIDILTSACVVDNREQLGALKNRGPNEWRHFCTSIRANCQTDGMCFSATIEKSLEILRMFNRNWCYISAAFFCIGLFLLIVVLVEGLLTVIKL